MQTIVLLVLAASLLLATPARAQEGGVSLDPAAQQIFNDVNQARIDHGLPPLSLNAELTLAAQRHVDDIIANGNWGHYGSDGSNVRTRAARAGYGSSSVSENWVAVASPERAIVWWMNDWIHRVNILGGHWDDIGVGAGVAPNGFYIFVTDFGNA
ncbi:MAG: CAP domain-containing protein, partial [Caldilinea sp.]